MKKLLCTLLALLPAVFGFTGCSESNEFVKSLPQINSFTLEKFTGRWYEAARLPHSFEKGLIRVTAEYTQRPDGMINVLNTGYKEEVIAKGGSEEKAKSSINGKAKLIQGSRKGYLKVSFFGPFYADYVIITLDEQNYQYAMIASSSRNYLWILSRTKALDEKIYTDLVTRAAKLGYETDKLIRVKQ